MVEDDGAEKTKMAEDSKAGNVDSDDENHADEQQRWNMGNLATR
jgi:hypothetical protein